MPEMEGPFKPGLGQTMVKKKLVRQRRIINKKRQTQRRPCVVLREGTVATSYVT